jgi:hypothetical protein
MTATYIDKNDSHIQLGQIARPNTSPYYVLISKKNSWAS